MASALAYSLVDQYCLARNALNEVESDLGELSAFLADVADAIVDDPQTFGSGRSDGLRQWPSVDTLTTMIESWRHYRGVMQAAWDRMSDQDRYGVGGMPPFGAPDPTRPLV